jgi:hypothetical protein
MPISKLQAAQQQLDCAIRLLFNLDDMPSVITLSRAAFRVLFDIYPVLKPDGDFGDALSGAIKGMGWPKFNAIANQLEHADNDANAMIDPHPIHAMVGIGLAITLYHQLTSSRTLEMQAFEVVMSVLEPDVFAGKPDPEAEGIRGLREGYRVLTKCHARTANGVWSRVSPLSEDRQGRGERSPPPRKPLSPHGGSLILKSLPADQFECWIVTARSNVAMANS